MIIVFYYSERYWIPHHHGLAPKIHHCAWSKELLHSTSDWLLLFHLWLWLVLRSCSLQAASTASIVLFFFLKKSKHCPWSAIFYAVEEAEHFFSFKKEGFYDKIL